MADPKLVEFHALVGTQGRITIPKHIGAQPGDLAIISALIVPVEEVKQLAGGSA